LRKDGAVISGTTPQLMRALNQRTVYDSLQRLDVGRRWIRSGIADLSGQLRLQIVGAQLGDDAVLLGAVAAALGTARQRVFAARMSTKLANTARTVSDPRDS
jgi:hypothetical protein